jgi:hypothetical protein
MKQKLQSPTNWLTTFRSIGLSLLLALTLVGCATGQPGEGVNHGFEIASTYDAKNLDIQYIGYCYGEREDYLSWARNCSVETATEKANNGTGHAGAAPMLVKKTLWVKWRNLKTGKVFEETVDLQKAWPNGFKDWRIYAHVKNDRLEVFVISIHPWQPQREYFKFSDKDSLEDHRREQKISHLLELSSRDKVNQIYPVQQIDPHLPPELRRKQ